MIYLRRERLLRELSENRLGLVARVDPSDVSKIERGRVVPTDDELKRLAAVLNVPADLLLREVPAP